MMMTYLQRWERRARYAMGAVAILAAFTALLFKLGWVKTSPSYDDAAWYSITEHAGFVVTTQHADENGCRNAAQSAAVVCRSGRTLSAKAISG